MNTRRYVTAGIAALLASAGAVAVSGSPAQAVYRECGEYVKEGRWSAFACITHEGTWAYADGTLNIRPASCATWRVYLVAEGADGDVLLKSTAALSCDNISASTADAVVSVPTRTKSMIVAWDARGNRILSLQSKAYNGT